MHTTRRIIWHMALWLVMAFPTLVTGPSAVAACNGMGQPAASSMPGSCCRTHHDACACHATPDEVSRAATHSDSCHKSVCSCAIDTAPERAPSPQAIVSIGFPAVLVSTPVIITPSIIRPVLSITCADQSPRSISRSSSSPRAPPFQG